MRSRKFLFDLAALIPLDVLQIRLGTQPLLRFPRFLKVSWKGEYVQVDLSICQLHIAPIHYRSSSEPKQETECGSEQISRPNPIKEKKFKF